MTLQAGIAAGHPATAEAGLEILAEGGTAADAAAAASFASCVAETVMTGIAGGGHLLWYEARSGTAELLDFFVAVPGLGRVRREPRLDDVGVPFGSEVVHYSIGIDSFAVPGVPAGLDELWRRKGRLPWARVVEPALRLARNGVPMPTAHAACLAMLEPVMTLGEGARIYMRGGVLLGPGDRLEQPGLARALEIVAQEGARTFYEGTVAEAILTLMDEREGLVTREDLTAYRPAWLEPVEGEYAGLAVRTRGGLARVAETLSAFPPLRGLTAVERALRLAGALEAPPYSGKPEHTTNLCVADGEGNVCVVTTSLGLGSGDFLPGYDMHLNSMLGETDLVVERYEPGRRMESMMAPTLLLDVKPAIAAGAAGGTRLRPALVQVLAGILDEGLPAQEAVSRPRLHSTGAQVHLEPGFEVGVAEALEAAGYRVRRWDTLHHYFGGVSALTRSGGAADPRRSGAALSLR